MGAVDATDFVHCYRRHYPRLVRALELGGAGKSTAEDVAQEAFARSLVHWARVRRGDNPAGYVYRTAFRLLYRTKKPELLTGTTSELAVTSSSVDAELRMSVDALLEKMPLRRRSCAVLCLILEFSPRDAGDILGMADGTVRKHLEQARADLRLGL